MKLLLIACCLVPVLTVSASDLEDAAALGKLTDAPKMVAAEGFESSENLKAVYFDALDWKGKPTKVFAWLGLPEKAEGKVPGVVLVHGGGGTAFREWVQKWNEQGFAAISIAVEGQTDQRKPKGADKDNPKGWVQHEWAGPRRSGIYHDSDVPLNEQWMYHAVADTVLANSLLRSLPEVDADKVGLMGISWGGVITSTVIGIDDRFAFAIPTYGCGDLSTAENQYGQALGDNEIYKQVWDPMLRLEKASMSTLWFSWPQDSHFPMDKQAACYRKQSGETMITLIPGMKHGHGAGWRPQDSYAFARSVVETGKPWGRQKSLKSARGKVEVVFESAKPLDRAELVSTVDTGVTGDRKWAQSEAELIPAGEGLWKVRAELPEGTTAWFVNALSGKLVLSSEFQMIQ